MLSQSKSTLTVPSGVTLHDDAADARGLRVAVVVSRYHDAITAKLLDGAIGALTARGAEREHIEVLPVPGSFELALAAARAGRTGRFDAIVVLGCVVRGETIHDRVIVRETTRGIGRAMHESGIPIGFGLLTVDGIEQAEQRAGGSLGNKGEEAALAAVSMVRLLRSVDAR